MIVFGKGGKTLVKTLGDLGKQVIFVEQDPDMYGGTCINVACIPSKKLKFLAETGSEFHQAIEKKNTLIDALNQANYDKVANVGEVVTGKASFVDEHTVSVDTEQGAVIIKADYIYINTGSKPRIPDIDGIKTAQNIYDSRGIMQLAKLPEHLTIVGGGYIGLEFASMFSEFGSKVTVLDSNSTFVPREDRDIAKALLETMQKQGIEFKFSQAVPGFENQDAQTLVKTAEGDLLADAVLIATGRVPNTDDLHPEKAGVKLTEKGYIDVNERLQTDASHIYAIGDVAGSPQFTYISLNDFRVICSQILGDGSYTIKDRTFPYTVFVNPPLSVVGMTEEMAKKNGYNLKTATLPANNIPKAKILEQTSGLLKAVVDAKTDKILGAQLFCARSHELINFMDLAIRQEMTYQEIAKHIFTHPTMSEGLNDLFGAIE